jgi:surface antigen
MNSLKISSAFLLFSVAIAIPRASATCSDGTMSGVLGYVVGAAVGQFTADGTGHITAGSETVSNKGVISTKTFTGTYSVATNCIGRLTINFTGGGKADANFVLDNGNKGAQIIDADIGTDASGFSLAQGTVTCGLTGIKRTFAANLLGKNSLGHVAYVAQVILNGTGGVSGSGTFEVNGSITVATITGTYTENSHCTGTLKITPKGLSTLNFNFVVVNGGSEMLLLETDAGTTVAGYMQQ